METDQIASSLGLAGTHHHGMYSWLSDLESIFFLCSSEEYSLVSGCNLWICHSWLCKRYASLHIECYRNHRSPKEESWQSILMLQVCSTISHCQEAERLWSLSRSWLKASSFGLLPHNWRGNQAKSRELSGHSFSSTQLRFEYLSLRRRSSCHASWQH